MLTIRFALVSANPPQRIASSTALGSALWTCFASSGHSSLWEASLTNAKVVHITFAKTLKGHVQLILVQKNLQKNIPIKDDHPPLPKLEMLASKNQTLVLNYCPWYFVTRLCRLMNQHCLAHPNFTLPFFFHELYLHIRYFGTSVNIRNQVFLRSILQGENLHMELHVLH
jgi:hypothetical protein